MRSSPEDYDVYWGAAGELRDCLEPEEAQDTRKDRLIATLLENFDKVTTHMESDLADFLAHSIIEHMYDETDDTLSEPRATNLWQCLPKPPFERESVDYITWFILASAFGPGHHQLKVYRDEMTRYWGQNFPSDRIFYPETDSRHQFAHFYGQVSHEGVVSRERASQSQRSPTSLTTGGSAESPSGGLTAEQEEEAFERRRVQLDLPPRSNRPLHRNSGSFMKIPSQLSNGTNSTAPTGPRDAELIAKHTSQIRDYWKRRSSDQGSEINLLQNQVSTCLNENEQLRQRADAKERESHEFRNELESLKQSIKGLRDDSQSKQTQLSEDMAKLKEDHRDEKEQLHEKLDATERENNGLRAEIGSLKESIKNLRDNSPFATMQDAQAQLSKDLADLRKEYDDESKLSRDRVKVLEVENNEFKSEIRNETSIQDLPDNSRFKTMDANHKALVDTQVALSVSHKVLNERQDTVDKGQSQISAEWNNHRKKCDARAQQQKDANESTRRMVNNLHIATDNLVREFSSPIPAKRKDDGYHEDQDGRKHARTS